MAVAANVTFRGPKPSCRVAVAVEIVGARLAVHRDRQRGRRRRPAACPSFTVTTTLNVPAVVNVCTGVLLGATRGVPSPKFHEYVSVSPSASVPIAVKVIGMPTRVVARGRAVRRHRRVAVVAGRVTVTGTSAVPVPPLPSDTVTLAV